MMNRSLKAYFLLFMVLGVQLVACAQSKPQKPNILFIAVDDLKPMLGTYGDTEIISPNMDALAARSVQFNNAYCQQAVCAVSRVSLFSGLRPDQTKVWDLKTNMRDVNPDVVTLPQYFMQQGYETVGLGKLMHGAKNNDPKSWSIPYKESKELVYPEGYKYPANGKYQAKEIHKAYRQSKKQKLGWKETNQYLKKMGLAPSVECMDVPDGAYKDGAVALAGIELLEELSSNDKPFFLALGFNKPHLPFAAPKKYWDMYERDAIQLNPYQEEAIGAPDYAYHTWGELRNYSDIPQQGPVPTDQQKELIHGYRACVSYVDAQIGLVMDKLDELGISDNTIIVLWGDHGWHLGDHGLWCKHSNFEQATRVPMMISAPGMQQGKQANTMAEFVDIYPTLCELSNLPVDDELDGLSLVPVLKNSKVEIKDYAISQYPRGNKVMGYSLRTKQYRLTLWLKGEFRKTDVYSNPDIVGVELYDYEKDPLEKESFAENEEYAEVRSLLQDKLLQILNSQP
ncbi:sulfatase [Carboxylicivirga sp. N1Y90]|uniref:sulfatase n=1 Tax=Carboxylicivirga fragile TaxID=3417571 RepID=UPI003D33A663|nr:sulfatase [Marinilabiliaceae bacterium N1Y90]